jgi:trans-aconitate methyltransferase
MNLDLQRQIDRLDWLQRWDAQQEGYVPEREARFTAMFGALAALLPASFVALDLACGPGSISQRLLTRFPGARAIAVDIDPVMLAIGQGTIDGRLRWIQADLTSPGWLEELGETQVDAVLSTTALHWLPPEPLARRADRHETERQR